MKIFSKFFGMVCQKIRLPLPSLKSILKTFLILFFSIQLSSCGLPRKNMVTHDGPPNHFVDVSHIPDAQPKVEAITACGNPNSYIVHGHKYHVMKSSKGYEATGIASWYGTKFHNHLTSDGETYSMYKMTAAHKSLPLPTYVKVTNLENGKQIIVKVNDRGPFEKNRLIDLSYVAAKKLGILKHGTGLVRIVAIDPRHLKTTTTQTQKLPAHKQPMIYVQVGAYSNKDNAQRIVKKVQTITTIPCRIYPCKINGRIIYRVQTGPVPDVNTSDELVTKLAKIGLKTPVTIIKEINNYPPHE